MKYLILTAFLFTGGPQPTYWRKLTRDDFKGPANGNYAALTTTQINLETIQDGTQYRFKATARFIPDKSFINSASEIVLDHEQGHFDITELFARKINTALQHINNCGHAYRVHDSLIIEWDKFQRLYDRETKHSVDTAAQKKWLKMIENYLSSK